MSMDRDIFWRMIADSRSALDPRDPDENQNRQVSSLQAALERLPPADIIAFGDELHALMLEAFRWDLWGVAYIAGDGCSNDVFADFRGWLVSMGRDAYESVLREPDSLARFVADRSVGDLFFERFQYVPAEAYEAVVGGEMPTAVKPDPFRKPAGTKWQASELPALFPKTWAAARALNSTRRH